MIVGSLKTILRFIKILMWYPALSFEDVVLFCLFKNELNINSDNGGKIHKKLVVNVKIVGLY